MIERIKFINATIKKYTDKYPKKDGMPDRQLSVKLGDTFVDIGGGWLKKDKNDNTYLSMKLQDAWVDHTNISKSRTGFCIVREDELTKLENEVKLIKGEVLEEEIPEEERNSDGSQTPDF